jgi:hypothetical protein
VVGVERDRRGRLRELFSRSLVRDLLPELGDIDLRVVSLAPGRPLLADGGSEG